MRRAFLLIWLCGGCVAGVAAHNIGSTPITWNREISRLVFDKCASCHRPGGSAFSMLTYPEVQPRVIEIKAAVLSRRMPPWGAIKGFGDFRNDQALTPEQIEMFVDWIQDDAPRGNNRRALPEPPKFADASPYVPPARVFTVSGMTTLSQPAVLDGVMPVKVPAGQSMRIMASLPDGSVEPLVWLHHYDDRYGHPFLFRRAMPLPAGTVIRGVAPGAIVNLIPAR
jgi:hypothetical protein